MIRQKHNTPDQHHAETPGKPIKPGQLTWRIYLLVGFIVCSILFVVGRLYHLQIVTHAYYQELADDQHKLREKILPHRGEIFLKEKQDLFSVAVNRELATIFAVPREVEDPAGVVQKLAPLLEMQEGQLREKISDSNDWYEVLKRKLPPEKEEQIKNLSLKGIYATNESWRYYPGGTIASQVIGFVGYNDNVIEGRYGVERSFEQRLRGEQGLLEQERDTGGRWISIGSKEITHARDGDDLILTLDHVVQFKAELALRSALERHGGDSGSIVIMEPSSGKIIAMATQPDFNLNDFAKTENVDVFLNPVVSTAFEAGSVMKTITMAAGLDSGKVSMDTTYLDTGQVVEAGYSIENSDGKANGVQTMTNVIEKSLNTGVIYVEKLVGNERFADYLREFGFGEKSGIDLPFEAAGNISNLKTNRNIEFFTASFGQGITVTPLQLVNAYSTIANGGELLKPQIIDAFRSTDGDHLVDKEVRRRVVSKQTANQIGIMLESNVLHGHGKLAGVPGYRVGGKTGTAQVLDKETGKYHDDITIGSFAGFAPIDNPQFSMLVIINNPKDVQWAESTAAPVFGEMAKFLFEYYGIEPTEPYSAKDLEIFNQKHNYLGAPDDQQSPQKEQLSGTSSADEHPPAQDKKKKSKTEKR